LSNIPNPSIDDTSFEILVDTAKKKIPLYSRSWTNYNLADPGITLIELFAWLADNQIYSLDRISDIHFLKFLKLLGVTLQDAESPILYLTINFKTIVQKNEPLILRKGSKFKSKKDSNDIIITTDHDVNLIPSLKVKQIVTFSNFKFQNYKIKEINDSFQETYITSYFYPFGENPRKNNSFYFGFEVKKDNLPNKEATQQISFTFYLYEDDLPQAGVHGIEDEMEYLEEFKSILKWEYLQKEKEEGNNNTNNNNLTWLPLNISHDKTLCFLKTGSITFTFPIFENEMSNAFQYIPHYSDNNNYNLFWIRCTLIENKYSFAPRIMYILPNTVKCTFGNKIIDKLVNRSLRLYDNDSSKSNGLVNQVFEISSKNFLPIVKIESLKVGKEKWSEVDDLDRSKPNDTHYTVDKEKGIFRFGDGENGMVPKRESEIEITFTFGNTANLVIKKNTSFELEDKSTSSNICSNLINGINLLPSTKGKKRENIQDAIIRTRRDLKIPYKVVSSFDCEYIARNTPGLRIGKIKAISSQIHMNTIEVSVIPFDFTQKPLPNEYFLNALRKHLDKHRLITTKILVKKPKYIGIIVQTTVSLKSNNNESENIRKKVYDLLDNLFRPISRKIPGINDIKSDHGTNHNHKHIDTSGWNFGQNVYRSEIIGKIESLEEIDCIYDLDLDAIEDKSSEIEETDFDKSVNFNDYGNDDSISSLTPSFTSTRTTTTNLHRSFVKKEGNIIINDLNLVYLKALDIKIISKLSDRDDTFNLISDSDKLNKRSSRTKDIINRDSSLLKDNKGTDKAA
jgi:hypothetical protein